MYRERERLLACKHIHTYTYSHVHVERDIHLHTSTYISLSLYIYIYTYIYTYTYRYIYIYTYIHTYDVGTLLQRSQRGPAALEVAAPHARQLLEVDEVLLALVHLGRLPEAHRVDAQLLSGVFPPEHVQVFAVAVGVRGLPVGEEDHVRRPLLFVAPYGGLDPPDTHGVEGLPLGHRGHRLERDGSVDGRQAREVEHRLLVEGDEGVGVGRVHPGLGDEVVAGLQHSLEAGQRPPGGLQS